MEVSANLNSSSSGLDLSTVLNEFPTYKDCLYLNTGSCGRKPQSVLRSLSQGLAEFNVNPTQATFLDESPWEAARSAAAKLFDVPRQQLLLTKNTTEGLQLIVQSCLIRSGDEVVTTDHEHGSLNALLRHLQETRGIIVRRLTGDPLKFYNSENFCRGAADLVNRRTKLIVVSEINSFTGSRLDLTNLVDHAKNLGVPLLVDGAHSPGQVVCRPSKYPMWVGSGHKWLGGPNGTGFVYVGAEYVPNIEPVFIGDKFFERKDADIDDLRRFEAQGSSDVVKWTALAVAIELQLRLGPTKILAREIELTRYLRGEMKCLNPQFRTPEIEDDSLATAMLAFFWPKERLSVADLKEALWQKHKIWVQPDFIADHPGYGMRISCHYSLTEQDIDKLVMSLREMLLG